LLGLALVRYAIARPCSRPAAFDARRFRLDEVRDETAQLRSAVRTAPFAGMDVLGAFRLAIRLEDDLMESQVFAVTEGDSPAVAAVLTKLAEATEGRRRHLAKSFSRKSH
jgi:hypothetical protein